MATKPRVKAPKTANAGEVVTIKTLISHPMESGQRKDEAGNLIPRNIIKRFEATFNGKPVFAADLAPSISANPYIEFHLRVTETGELKMIWIEDGGATFEDTQTITLK